jgi:CRP-like cAMP-binding protein
MQSEAKPESRGATSPPLAELLACPAAIADLLSASAENIAFGNGETIFHQGAACRGLYVIVSGQLQRRADRSEARLVLGAIHAGDLVELAAALGDGRHTYTLTAQTGGWLMMLPKESLQQAFDLYPPLRMQLLEELGREVSRAYFSSCAARTAESRRRGARSAADRSGAR